MSEARLQNQIIGVEGELAKPLGISSLRTIYVFPFPPQRIKSYLTGPVPPLTIESNATLMFCAIFISVSKPWWEKENLTSECPVPGFCLNRGQCIFYKSIGEMVCVYVRLFLSAAYGLAIAVFFFLFNFYLSDGDPISCFDPNKSG